MGIFKKMFEKAVNKEVERKEAERKAEIEAHSKEFWDKLEESNKKAESLQKWQNLYTMSEQAYKSKDYDRALYYLDLYISEAQGGRLGTYVFIRLVDIQKELGGKEGVLGAYERAEAYYTDYPSERGLYEIQMMKEDYLKEIEYMDAMQSRYNFEVTVELAQALKRLEGLKVNEYRYDDYSSQDSFDAVWRSVLHEVDLFEEGEESPLNKTTAKGAKRWLKEFSHLCKDVRIPDEYKPKEG